MCGGKCPFFTLYLSVLLGDEGRGATELAIFLLFMSTRDYKIFLVLNKRHFITRAGERGKPSLFLVTLTEEKYYTRRE